MHKLERPTRWFPHNVHYLTIICNCNYTFIFPTSISLQVCVGFRKFISCKSSHLCLQTEWSLEQRRWNKLSNLRKQLTLFVTIVNILSRIHYRVLPVLHICMTPHRVTHSYISVWYAVVAHASESGDVPSVEVLCRQMGSRSRKKKAEACRRQTSSARTTRASRGRRAPELTPLAAAAPTSSPSAERRGRLATHVQTYLPSLLFRF